MAEVDCARCGTRATALERAPLPGAVGERVLAQTCAACWKGWMSTQVKLMNEHRLSPANPQHYTLLVREMSTYLQLRDE